jgi:hypothetical protein
MSRFRKILLLLAVVTVTLAGAPAYTIPPPVDYVLCSCSLCKAQPDIDCQISPSGYSIMCSDWYRMHC